MRVWRICKAEHAATAFTGEGAMAYAGRWHHSGTAAVYCSESRALAALEQLVHLHRNRLPPHFVCFGVEIPADVAIREVRVEDLPAEWRRLPGPPELRDIGTRWAESGETVVLRVPSAVVLGEHNFLANPRHPDFRELAIGEAEPFEFDERLVPSRESEPLADAHLLRHLCRAGRKRPEHTGVRAGGGRDPRYVYQGELVRLVRAPQLPHGGLRPVRATRARGGGDGSEARGYRLDLLCVRRIFSRSRQSVSCRDRTA